MNANLAKTPEVDRAELARVIAETYSTNMAKRFPARMGVTGAPLEHLGQDEVAQAELIADAVLALLGKPQ